MSDTATGGPSISEPIFSAYFRKAILTLAMRALDEELPNSIDDQCREAERQSDGKLPDGRTKPERRAVFRCESAPGVVNAPEKAFAEASVVIMPHEREAIAYGLEISGSSELVETRNPEISKSAGRRRHIYQGSEEIMETLAKKAGLKKINQKYMCSQPEMTYIDILKSAYPAPGEYYLNQGGGGMADPTICGAEIVFNPADMEKVRRTLYELYAEAAREVHNFEKSIDDGWKR